MRPAVIESSRRSLFSIAPKHTACPLPVQNSFRIKPVTRHVAPEQMAYANSRRLSLGHDNRLRPTRWDVPGVLGSDYEYVEGTFRATFARSRTDSTLDRWYWYDHVGRLM